MSLPPLNALKAFEATARHLSVKGAAQELCVTPGAVSQMVKTLEQRLGVPLFVRSNRAITLTPAGQSYLPAIRNAFRQIADATDRIARSGDTGTLTLSVTPFFASTWLVPRLASFQEAHPEVDLQVVGSNGLVDFGRDPIDLAIRHGLGRYPGLASHRIVTVEVVPVAAPSLVAKHGKPKDVAAIGRFPQVHDAERKAWHFWLQAQEVAEIGPARGAAFDDSSLLLGAVLAGQGAGLLPAALVASDITAGRLVKLADEALLQDFAYYLVYPSANCDRPMVAAFRDWILREAKVT